MAGWFIFGGNCSQAQEILFAFLLPMYLCVPLFRFGDIASGFFPQEPELKGDSPNMDNKMWANLNFLVGSWQGTGTGQPGNSQVERIYRFILNSRFIEAKNKSIYPPQDQNLKGEVHEDLGLISYDKGRNAFVLRQFHIEGFVNQYVMDYLAPDGRTIVFTTESIENIPAGWRARETYQIIGSDVFTETFELAEPGNDFEVYTRNHFKRVAGS